MRNCPQCSSSNHHEDFVEGTIEFPLGKSSHVSAPVFFSDQIKMQGCSDCGYLWAEMKQAIYNDALIDRVFTERAKEPQRDIVAAMH